MHPRLNSILETTKVPHALLLSGPSSLTIPSAYSFSLALQKTSKKIEEHPDIRLYFPEGKTLMHPIESIRQMIAEAVLSPFEAKWKIFIVHQAEKMLPTSSNALLKLLEEPPAQTLLLLLSEYPQKLLPTILSRCQQLTHHSSTSIKREETFLKILAGELPKDSLSTFESDNPRAVFETVLFWYRDRLLIELGANELLHFPDYQEKIKAYPLIPLSKVQETLNKLQLAHERSTKLSLCLEMFDFLIQH